MNSVPIRNEHRSAMGCFSSEFLVRADKVQDLVVLPTIPISDHESALWQVSKRGSA
jgi:hypothetical protein